MTIACHYAIPRPPYPELDAAIQDGMNLLKRTGGEINFLYPGSRVKRWIPRFFCGIHQLPYLRKLDKRIDVHQIFSNGIYPYPILHFFTKPIVYTSVIHVRNSPPPLWKVSLKRVNHFVVATINDQKTLEQENYSCKIILPGIEIGHFSDVPLPMDNKMILLSASAPWTREQFEIKGVDALLRAAANLPWLHLVFLWRGKLLHEMKARISRYNLTEKVTVINQSVDVNEILKKVHAGIVLAADSDIVKAYPHSLLESLAAAKPVLVSSCLPMAQYVAQHNCGVLVDGVNLADLLDKISLLRSRYQFFVGRTRWLDMSIFSRKSMVASYLELYRQVG